MKTSHVVEAFDVVADGGRCLRASIECLQVDELALDSREEALRDDAFSRLWQLAAFIVRKGGLRGSRRPRVVLRGSPMQEKHSERADTPGLIAQRWDLGREITFRRFGA